LVELTRFRKGIIVLNRIESILHGISGGKVLDVATHEGHFVKMLDENLMSYRQIVGIDVDEKSIRTAATNLAKEIIRFVVMDAERLAFESECFDTVNISASLHHLTNVPRVLSEMVRVLKPGGHFILLEMHGDGQTEAAQTFISLHQWVAQVDSALGLIHHKTFSRQEFIDCAAQLGFSKVELADVIDTDSDPMETARIEQLERLITRTMQRAAGTNQETKLKAHGNELLQRLHEFGAQREPIIIVVGTK
jgi:ubiquinone/menaquinone biosynthesis C-methylase UbiE